MLKTDYKDDMFEGTRRWKVTQNQDGTQGIEDVTTYTQKGDTYGSKDVNAANTEINRLGNAVVVSLPASGWSGSLPYGQTVAVPGAKATDVVGIHPYTPKELPAATVKQYRKLAGMITDGESGDGTMAFYCGGKKTGRRLPGHAYRSKYPERRYLMAKAVIMGGGGGGVSSDELTAARGDVLKGKTAVTSDSSDEPAEGTLELTGDAADSHVLTGKTYYNKDPKTKRTGTMPNRGAVAQELVAGGSYTVLEGYHNGAGKVTAKSLASQTGGATAADGDVLSGRTYWKDGVKRTGSMANQGSENSSIKRWRELCDSGQAIITDPAGDGQQPGVADLCQCGSGAYPVWKDCVGQWSEGHRYSRCTIRDFFSVAALSA